jgi:hypothetical protein
VTVPVPFPLPATSSWTVADWLDRPYISDPAGSDGVATITLPPLPDNERWQLTHAVVSCTSAAATQMRLYFDSAAIPNLRDGSSAGNFNVADWPQGLQVPPGRALLARWDGCDPGAVATLALQATILRRA